MRRRFFVECFSDGRARMEGPAAHHLARVLRASEGQLYELSDGREVFLARVERAGRDAVEFALVEPVAAAEPRLRATLLLAVVKFDRFEWALEKATELGATAIAPLATERSEKGLLAAAAKRAQRWKTILLESSQQARCLRPPELLPMQKARDAFREAAPGASRRVILSERVGAPPLGRVLSEMRNSVGASQGLAPDGSVKLCLAAGPEGGWTDGEFAAAASAQFAEASLGERVLRTETAVVAGMAAAHLYFDA